MFSLMKNLNSARDFGQELVSDESDDDDDEDEDDGGQNARRQHVPIHFGSGVSDAGSAQRIVTPILYSGREKVVWCQVLLLPSSLLGKIEVDAVVDGRCDKMPPMTSTFM